MKTKKLFLMLSIAVLGFVACTKTPNEGEPTVETKESYIDATSKTTWHYFSLSENKIVGSGEETVEANAAWGARSDWDVAIKRYELRTNSGEFTKSNAQGGVYIYETNKADGDIYVFDNKIPFSSILSVPSGVEFKIDKSITISGMGGETTTVQSVAEIIKMKMKWDDVSKKWSREMPPVYLKAPLCIFRTADGKGYYKVEFTQYLNDEGKTGHVKFYSEQLK